MAYSDDVIALSPQHYWTLDNVLTDSGTGTALTLTGSGTAFVATPLNPDSTNSAEWGRASDDLAAATSTDLDNLTITAYTISLLIRPTLDTLPFSVFKLGSDTTGIACFLAGGMVPAFTTVSGGTTVTVFANRPLTINQAANVVFRYNAGTMDVFIDGRNVGTSSSAATSIGATTNGVDIGGNNSTSQTVAIPGGTFTVYTLSAQMSDIATWTSALSDSDIFDTLFSQAALPITATATFTNVPEKTEIRLFDTDTPGLDEIGGVEFVSPSQDIEISYTVTTELNARLAVLNVEDVFNIFYGSTTLTREGVTIPADLLLIEDNVYNGDFVQLFPPESSVAPIISGTAGVGEVLTVTDTGQWGIGTTPFTFTYQWRRDGTPIAGATNSTYTTVLADDETVITCEVTATNAAGSDSAVSNPISLLSSGQVGIWRHTTGATAGTAAAVIDFDTEDRNDSSFFSKTGSTWNLPQGRYLVSYQFAWLASGLNGRGNVVVEARKDGAVIPGSKGSAYQRDTANDAGWANCTFIFDADDVAGNDLDFRHFRDTDASVGAYDSNRSILHIISLDNSTSYGEYVLSGTGNFGGTTYTTPAIGTTVTETGGNITRTGDDISLAANRSYMLCGGAYFNGTTARTSRFTHFTRGGTHIPGSSGYAYLRQGSDEFGAPNSFCVIETGGTAETINFQARGPGPGGTPVNGSASIVPAESGITIIELKSGAEWYASEDGTMAQDTSVTTPLNLNFNRTVTRSDSGALFSSGTTSTLTTAVAATMFVAAGIHIRRTTSNGTRLTREADIRLGGTAQVGTASGEYNRGDQGSQDCYDSTMNPRGIISTAVSQSLTVVSSKDADGGWNDGGGTPQTSSENLGFYALRADTL